MKYEVISKGESKWFRTLKEAKNYAGQNETIWRMTKTGEVEKVK